MIARVFARQTEASPVDDLAFYDMPGLFLPDITEVHVSCTFTYDKRRAEWLANQWESVAPVKMGGPAYDDFTKDFIPGRYLKPGYTITSVGCNNKCWFCRVPKVAGSLKELEIKDGWIIQDDNLLSCSEGHIKAVFEMLKRQKHRAEFRGGLEAKLLKPWHVELLRDINPKNMFFAYDTPDDYEPLVVAGKMLNDAGFTLRGRKKFAYVLIGYPKDRMYKAEKRLKDTLRAGFMPFAMLYKNQFGQEDETWRRFQRTWARPAIIAANNKDIFREARHGTQE